MYPTDQKWLKMEELACDDILRMQKLYGRKKDKEIEKKIPARLGPGMYHEMFIILRRIIWTPHYEIIKINACE